MPDEKITKAAEKTAKTTEAAAKAPAEKKSAPAKKTAAKKPVEKAAKAPAKATKSTKTAKTAKAADKPAKTTRAKKPAKAAVTLDDLTTAVWKKLEEKDVSNVPYSIAIQVNAYEVGTFYIAVKADPEYDKQVIQSDYYLPDGILETSADEIKKMAAGNYDFIAAVKAGSFTYRGDLTKAVIVAGLIK